VSDYKCGPFELYVAYEGSESDRYGDAEPLMDRWSAYLRFRDPEGRQVYEWDGPYEVKEVTLKHWLFVYAPRAEVMETANKYLKSMGVSGVFEEATRPQVGTRPQARDLG
jgi:hypothetical protein